MDNHPTYEGTAAPATLSAFKNRDCARLFDDPLYQEPTPEEVSALIKIAGWSQREAANIVGAASNTKGSTTIRKWRAAIGSKEHRKIPYSAWRLMLLHAHVVKL